MRSQKKEAGKRINLMSRLKFLSAIALVTTWFGTASIAEQIIFVDFKTGRLLHYYGDKREPDVYPVVLPRSSVQVQMNLIRPVHGEVIQVDHKPTWWPTKTMRQRNPSLPSAIKYGEPGHPIGLYRLRIKWKDLHGSVADFWREIRVHGGAKAEDLHREFSAGCIRMTDEDIARLVEKMVTYGGEVRVTFMPPQFL